MIVELQKFLEGINRKKEEAWKQLYADYYSPLCCYALKILKDEDCAADVVQGTIVKMWEAEVYFDQMSSFHGYLYRSIYNNCLKVIRDKSIENNYLNHHVPEEFDEPMSFVAVLEEEIVRRLRAVIDQMPQKRREVMLLCMEEKTVEEISGILDISVNTVKKHKKEAYQFIREVISPDILVLFYLFSKSNFRN